ncbi:MAG: nickel pincer cofactor biosynthesis protein LarC [Victivallales bacterium]|nr:nickel pincer cofactor biosynthesis protein LarC [Victivallales bacterium]
MRTLYLDCGMGAAGDMIAAALYELLDDKEGFLRTMNSAGMPGVSVSAEPSVKCGIVGTHFRVAVNGAEEECQDHHHDHGHEHNHEHNHAHEHENDHEHEHHHEHSDEHHHDHAHEHSHTHAHRSMAEIEEIIASLALPELVKSDVIGVYGLIAEAEGQAHGMPVSEIHFHEVGTMDAIADIASVCLLMNLLKVDRVVASPVHVGSGHVHCAHGILPVPAPATAHILKGVPIYGGHVDGELCTPTGAALLKKFVSSFGEMPAMTVVRIGYGMGKKDFEAANCVRALLGETEDGHDDIVELSCNLDDMTPERIGFATDLFFAEGALDVFTVPIGMKKSRPGVMLCVICREDDREKMVRLFFRHTTTLGIRENRSRRYTLKRSVETIGTPCGEVRVKRSSGYGVERRKFEYEDLARIAREKGISIDEAKSIIEN